MHSDPDIERLKRLRLHGYAPKCQIVFCPKCDFQYEPQTLGKSECPDCGRHLNVVTLTPDLQELCENYERAEN